MIITATVQSDVLACAFISVRRRTIMKALLIDRYVMNTDKTSDQIIKIIKDNVDTKHPYIMRRYNSSTFFMEQ